MMNNSGLLRWLFSSL